jgi:3-oxoacyl-[acyl-carrier protein] reductase
LCLARHGWDVAFTYLHSDTAAQEVSEHIRSFGVHALPFKCDAGVKSEVDELYSKLSDWAGDVPDLLVNNAGIQTWCPLLELKEESWDRVIRTNLKGCFLNTQRVAQLMVARKKRGTIVNIGSGSNKLAFPNLVDYTASKGGIEQLTKVAAIELGTYGIRVNCVAPGAIEIERTRREAPRYAEMWAEITPLGRVGRTKDVGELVVFLTSPGAQFITGQTIWVDGGVFSRANWPYPPSPEGAGAI